MDALADAVDAAAERTGFSGVVSVDRGGTVEFAKAYGLAHRPHRIANTVGTRFAIASGTKALTALVIAGLVERGRLEWSTTARSVLGADLPLIAGDVTVEHLMAHRSGIGDYVDEDAGHALTDYVLTVPPQALVTTEQYVAALEGRPAKFAPGARFAYCNSGFVVLALIAERVSGIAFHDLVRDRVCGPAGMPGTSFPRSDEPPDGVATGYLDAVRTNVFHLPVRGSGDGGAYSTVADISALWRALFAGTIVGPELVATLLHPHSDVPAERRQYGLGFWLTGSGVLLEGLDPGVSFRSVHDPATGLTSTVIANTATGAWPIARALIPAPV